jgi:hypothetical protein
MATILLALGGGGLAEDAAPPAPPSDATVSDRSPEDTLVIAKRFFSGGAFEEARELLEGLFADPRFRPLPPPEGGRNGPDTEEREAWLRRQVLREEAYFYHARALLELAEEDDDRLEEAIEAFRLLAEGEKGFANPAYLHESLF